MEPIRKDTQVPQPSGPTESVADEVVYKELGDRLVRAATTASSLEAKQDSDNITKTQFKATPNEPKVVDAAYVSTATTTVTITTKEITFSQALKVLKTSIPKVKGIEFQEPAAKSLQAEFNKEERLARKKAKMEQEASIALIETWDGIQAKIEADHRLLKDYKHKNKNKNKNKKSFYTDLHVGREEVSSYTTYTFNDLGKEASK
nr:hypothetical protein [Tanacetum cinerariifolium]